MNYEERIKWLKTLKVGDKVANEDRIDKYSIFEIKKITKTGRIRLDNDILLNKEGRNWHGDIFYNIKPLTEEILYSIEIQKEKEKKREKKRKEEQLEHKKILFNFFLESIDMAYMSCTNYEHDRTPFKFLKKKYDFDGVQVVLECDDEYTYNYISKYIETKYYTKEEKDFKQYIKITYNPLKMIEDAQPLPKLMRLWVYLDVNSQGELHDMGYEMYNCDLPLRYIEQYYILEEDYKKIKHDFYKESIKVYDENLDIYKYDELNMFHVRKMTASGIYQVPYYYETPKNATNTIDSRGNVYIPIRICIDEYDNDKFEKILKPKCDFSEGVENPYALYRQMKSFYDKNPDTSEKFEDIIKRGEKYSQLLKLKSEIKTSLDGNTVMRWLNSKDTDENINAKSITNWIKEDKEKRYIENELKIFFENNNWQDLSHVQLKQINNIISSNTLDDKNMLVKHLINDFFNKDKCIILKDSIDRQQFIELMVNNFEIRGIKNNDEFILVNLKASPSTICSQFVKECNNNVTIYLEGVNNVVWIYIQNEPIENAIKWSDLYKK